MHAATSVTAGFSRFTLSRVQSDMLVLSAGLVLLNSAGKIEPEYQPPSSTNAAAPKAPPPRFVVEVSVAPSTCH
jgi:hypothetical protein